MIYVFDTSSFSEMGAYYPKVFVGLWKNFNQCVNDKTVTSTIEVYNEVLNCPHNDIKEWAEINKSIFPNPDQAETEFVAEIFRVPKFRESVQKKQLLRGTPVADPFVIARAKILNGCVVTQEKYADGSARIPII